jgi:hypothetical protein
MSRKTKTATSADTKRSTKFTHGDLLRKALTWVFNDRMFADVQLHGNIKWTPKQLVILAVLWVWSDKRTLSRSFVHARRLSLVMFGSVGVTTFQGLTGALKKWSVKLLPRTQRQLHALMEEVSGTI